MLEAIAVAWLLLFFGDFLSTFIYHVPEHVFGSLHLKTHHSWKKDFRHYAILTFNPQVLLDGILGALPYVLIAVA
ncbi:MAG: fatty acid hydroxylase, partial [Nostoc sp.]